MTPRNCSSHRDVFHSRNEHDCTVMENNVCLRTVKKKLSNRKKTQIRHYCNSNDVYSLRTVRNSKNHLNDHVLRMVISQLKRQIRTKYSVLSQFLVAEKHDLLREICPESVICELNPERGQQ